MDDTIPGSKSVGFDPIRTLLEDFTVLGDRLLVATHDVPSLGPSVTAALIAHKTRLRSIDYAKRKYVDGASNSRRRQQPPIPTVSSYIAAYKAAKAYIFAALNKLVPEGRRDPTVGEFGASIALERLPHSLFCAHLLYRLGHRYEGHAVSRHILEQIAWAYAAFGCSDVPSIAKLVTTKTITQLARLIPAAGKLYGLLSRKTHVDYASHSDFLRIHQGQNAILMAQPQYSEYASVVLQLADAFGAVWEATQFEFIVEPEAVLMTDGHVTLNPNRPFVLAAGKHLADIIQASDTKEAG